MALVSSSHHIHSRSSSSLHTESADTISAKAAKAFLESTDKEKKALQGLNDRLSNYIERVKKLEEQNIHLVSELSELKGRFTREAAEIRAKYADAIAASRRDIEAFSRRKAEASVKVDRFRLELNDFHTRHDEVQYLREADRARVGQWAVLITDATSELELLKSRWAHLRDESKHLHVEHTRLWEELAVTRASVDEEVAARTALQIQISAYKEELVFLRKVHEKEVHELHILLSEAPADTREFFKNELALAIRDIKDEYDYIAKQGKIEMESWYKLKVSEVQTSSNRQTLESTHQREEITRMSSVISEMRGTLSTLESKHLTLEKEVQSLTFQLTDDQRQYELALSERDATFRRMREECQLLVAELQSLLDTKQMLDAEIAIYRKMLEGEEIRVGQIERSAVVVGGGSSSSTHVVRSSSSSSRVGGSSSGLHISGGISSSGGVAINGGYTSASGHGFSAGSSAHYSSSSRSVSGGHYSSTH